ncbi:SPX (SYG1/Pho81/XPR1) domain-containing protein [Wolffia australiana]
MKFGKRYQEYMQGQVELPQVGIKRLKNMLKKCRKALPPEKNSLNSCVQDASESRCCQQHCQVCDGTFFPALVSEMSAVSGCFNERARRLLELHLATGLKKYVNVLKRRMHISHHDNLMQEGKDLVNYAIIHSIAMRKLLKKYDKIHYSKKGQEFKSHAQEMQIEILQSPWLAELMAFYINERECTAKKKGMAATEAMAATAVAGLFRECSLEFNEGKPVLCCSLFDSMKLEVNLTCSICLDTVFDPVSLSCGHIFCYVCGCSAASTSIVDGLKAADSKARCPLCRQDGVYNKAVHLDELCILLKNSCPEYWKERQQSERAERVRLAKEHWESLCQAFTGI